MRTISVNVKMLAVSEQKPKREMSYNFKINCFNWGETIKRTPNVQPCLNLLKYVCSHLLVLFACLKSKTLISHLSYTIN